MQMESCQAGELPLVRYLTSALTRATSGWEHWRIHVLAPFEEVGFTFGNPFGPPFLPLIHFPLPSYFRRALL